jgi:cell division control protein 45
MLLQLSQVDAVWTAIRMGSVRALIDSTTEHDAVLEALLWRKGAAVAEAGKRVKRVVAPRGSDGALLRPRQVCHQAATCFIVAPNVDALATTRTLTLLHQADSLPYHVYPIHHYSEIARLRHNGLSITDHQDACGTSSLRAIIFVNCGAGVDVGALLDLPADTDLPVLVIDAHRPYHLRNLESSHVIVLHDSDVLDTRLPDSGYEDALGRLSFNDAEEAYSSSDSDVANESEQQGAARRRRHRSERRGGRATRRYYQQTHQAATSAGIAYALAANLNRATTEALWCWILAVTEQFLNRQAGNRIWYEQLIRCIREEWKRLTSRGLVDQSDPGTIALPPLEPSEEFSLELLRHWTLYDSLLQSSWLAVRIRSWRQQAERRVSEILALLGISLRESKQRWMHMSSEHKDIVRERLVSVLRAHFQTDLRVGADARAPGHGAADLVNSFRYESFVRRYGAHRGQTASASDVVLAINALLDRGYFWRGYALLQCQHIGQMASSFELAKRHQRLLLDAATTILEGRAYMRGRRSWYAILDGPPAIVAHLDGKYQLQRRLALLLGDWLYITRASSGRHARPFWLIVLKPDNESAVVTVITPQLVETEGIIQASCLERDLRFYRYASPETAVVLTPVFDCCDPVQVQLPRESVLALTRCFR